MPNQFGLRSGLKVYPEIYPDKFGAAGGRRWTFVDVTSAEPPDLAGFLCYSPNENGRPKTSVDMKMAPEVGLEPTTP